MTNKTKNKIEKMRYTKPPYVLLCESDKAGVGWTYFHGADPEKTAEQIISYFNENGNLYNLRIQGIPKQCLLDLNVVMTEGAEKAREILNLEDRTNLFPLTNDEMTEFGARFEVEIKDTNNKLILKEIKNKK